MGAGNENTLGTFLKEGREKEEIDLRRRPEITRSETEQKWNENTKTFKMPEKSTKLTL